MSGFDQLLHELRDGVERQAANPTTRRQSRAWRLPLLALLATLGLGGVAFAAATLLERGDRVPVGPHRSDAWIGAEVTAVRVLPLRAADPDGGLTWGLGTFRPRSRTGSVGSVTCVRFGRVQQDQLGVIGRDGTFSDDGLFHPLEPMSSQSGLCGGSDRNGQLLLSGSAFAVPASGYSGDPRARAGGVPIAGCSNPGETPTASQSTCPAASMRLLKFGFAGNEAVDIVWANRHARFDLIPPAGSSGAYLFVYRAEDIRGGGPMTLTTTYRDGTVCRDFSPTRSSPQSIQEQFRRHQRANPGCQSPPGFKGHTSR